MGFFVTFSRLHMLLKIAKISYAAVALTIILWAMELWLFDLPWYMASVVFWVYIASCAVLSISTAVLASKMTLTMGLFPIQVTLACMCCIPIFWYLYTSVVLGPILLITSALILNQGR